MIGGIAETLTKWLVVAGLLMYAVFGVILIMQAKVMSDAFESDANPVVKLVAMAHLLLTLMLAVVAALIL